MGNILDIATVFSMVTALISHPDCRLHEMGSSHPECPARTDVINDKLLSLRLLDLLAQYDAPLATREQLLRVHSAPYLDWLQQRLPESGYYDIDLDTQMNPKTLVAAHRAAGAAVLATDLVASRRVENAFCNIRPPGHHASSGKSMGFCFFNNVAVAAAHALAEYPIERVAILDFDVHHGNGTDVIFENDPRVMVCSLFQRDLWPFASAQAHENKGINVALPAGSGGEEMRKAVRAAWLPALAKFQPEMVFVSAGFDAHASDEMSDLLFSDGDFRWLSELTLSIAKSNSGGRYVSVLEGGYDLDSLARCAAAHVRILAGLYP
jgi:acetoin utilization deacetylase AcuC-like enzyme